MGSQIYAQAQMIEPGSEAMLEFLLFLLGFENGFVREKNRRVESILEKYSAYTQSLCARRFV